ncbi:MAG: c-type cytochrome [Chloroflexi bacterium]|nr:c-type cytochrome [Chloroflexota bacterium]
MMKRKLIWYFGGALVAGLAALSVSCALVEPPNPPLPVAKIVPPAIPHTLEGRADCRLCHDSGLGGAPRFPADHSERPSDVCVVCHVKAPANGGREQVIALEHPVIPPPAPTPPVSPAKPAEVSAKDLYGGKCAACHGANRQGVPGFAPALTPESLAALSDDQTRFTISDGRAGTGMPPFKTSLSADEINALVEFIKYTLP